MRRPLLLPLCLLAFSCTDGGLVEPQLEADLGTIVTSDHAGKAQYTFQVNRDWFCGEVEQNDLGCRPGTNHTTPSLLSHTEGFKALFFVSGQLSGELWVMGDFHLNLRNGKGVANGTVRFDLSDPGDGSFFCQVHAEYAGYHAPHWAYVEHARYFGCEGTGDFEGKAMTAWLNNEANPGLPIVDGVAEIW